jgi:rhamnogalacturonyl hydrolase YesR
MTTTRKIVLSGILTVCMLHAAGQVPITPGQLNRTLTVAATQYLELYASVKSDKDKIPRSTDQEGRLITCDDKWWTSGFFPGTLWYLYQYTQNKRIADAAADMTQRLIRQQYTTDNHDVGFIINCSFGNELKTLPAGRDKQVIINAAKSLSTRFNSKTGCIRSWNSKRWEYPVIIDNMMNLELLCEATKLSGDSTYMKIAVSHADTTMKYHFRPDGSSYHMVVYDTLRSGAKERITYQGYADGSAWARGQAWGLYGFTMMYRETGKRAYLDHAIKIAGFIINHKRLPADKIPYWDFDAPDIPHALRDASAGAVIASALIELSGYAGKDLHDKYLETARIQLATLSGKEFRSDLNENGNFLLRHCVGFLAKNSEVNVPLSYADYYYVEALTRLAKKNFE